jgi:SPP1 gp7 family putative phage head morphogenesis protein
MPDRNDVTSSIPALFKQMLKMKRREMGYAARSRNKYPNMNIMWLYPFAYERQYRKYVWDLMNVYSDMALPVIQNNLERWIAEHHSDSRQDDFNSEFQKLIDSMQKKQYDMFAEGGAGVEAEGNFFNWKSIGVSLAALGFTISKFNQKQEDKVTTRILGKAFIPAEPWLPPVVDLWKAENFGLIKSLSDDYIKQLNHIVSEGVANNESMQKIMKSVRGMDNNISRTRATLLTRDQVGKLNGRLTKKRSLEAGLDLYRWSTVGDERVRPSHKNLNNKICQWSDNSVYANSVELARAGNWLSRDGANMYVGTPGQDIQCRCTSIPIADDIVDEVDEELKGEIL